MLVALAMMVAVVAVAVISLIFAHSDGSWPFGGSGQKLEDTLKETVVEIFGLESLSLLDEAVKGVVDKLDKVRNLAGYEAEVERLKEALFDLRIKRNEIEAQIRSEAAESAATWDREKTDIEFKTGLLRDKHAQDLDLNTRKAIMDVREENLTKDQQRFADQMEFERNQMKGEMESLRTLTAQLLERLPDVKAIIRNG